MPRSALQLLLTLQHGPFIGSAKVANLLSFPSLSALTSARHRGKLPIAMQQLPDRKGWYARTIDVAHWIESIEQVSDSSPEMCQQEKSATAQTKRGRRTTVNSEVTR
jgi:hypothetical protein